MGNLHIVRDEVLRHPSVDIRTARQDITAAGIRGITFAGMPCDGEVHVSVNNPRADINEFEASFLGIVRSRVERLTATARPHNRADRHPKVARLGT